MSEPALVKQDAKYLLSVSCDESKGMVVISVTFLYGIPETADLFTMEFSPEEAGDFAGEIQCEMHNAIYWTKRNARDKMRAEASGDDQ